MRIAVDKNYTFLLHIVVAATLVATAWSRRRTQDSDLPDPKLDTPPLPPGPVPGLNSSSIGSYVGGPQFEGDQPELQVGCKELRSKRFISDGFCTSIKPITEVVCTGHCLPIRNLPWYAEFIKVWARTKVLEWRCVENEVRRKKVTLMCENGESRTYRIKVVKSCKCKKYMRPQNQSIATIPNRDRDRENDRDRDRSKDRDRGRGRGRGQRKEERGRRRGSRRRRRGKSRGKNLSTMDSLTREGL